MRDYTAKAEDRDDFTWRVTLSDKETGSTIALVYIDKSDFPTKKDAIKYLVDGYNTSRRERKKKSSESNSKRKTKKNINGRIKHANKR